MAVTDNYTWKEASGATSAFKAKAIGGVKHPGHIGYKEDGTPVDFATQTTLAALLARLADPATQSTLALVLAQLNEIVTLAQGAGLKVDLATAEGGVTINVANGDFAALGLPADAAVIDPASSGSLVALIKGALTALNTIAEGGGSIVTANAGTKLNTSALATDVHLTTFTSANHNDLAALLTVLNTIAEGGGSVVTANAGTNLNTSLLATDAHLTALTSANHTDLGTILTALQALRSTGTLDGIISAMSGVASLHADVGTTLHGDLTTLNGKDFATQTTLAAVLAKLTSDPATQTTLAAILTALGTNHTDEVQLHTDVATTLHGDLGALHTDIATTLLAKDEAIRALLAGTLTVSGAVTNAGTFAVQAAATVAAGAANIAKAEDVASADADVGVPAMAVRKATPANTSSTDGDYEMLQMLNGRLYVRGEPRILSVAASAYTRPANTTPYTGGDAVSNNATAGSVTAVSFSLSDTNDDPITIDRLRLLSTDTGVQGKNFRAWFFNSDPTASTGVGGGDNTAWSQKQAGFIGSMSGNFRIFSDGAGAVLTPDEGMRIITTPVSGAKTIFMLLQTLDAFTPSANSTTFTGTVEGFQGRA